jgi:hypothetical protein
VLGKESIISRSQMRHKEGARRGLFLDDSLNYFSSTQTQAEGVEGDYEGEEGNGDSLLESSPVPAEPDAVAEAWNGSDAEEEDREGKGYSSERKRADSDFSAFTTTAASVAAAAEEEDEDEEDEGPEVLLELDLFLQAADSAELAGIGTETGTGNNTAMSTTGLSQLHLSRTSPLDLPPAGAERHDVLIDGRDALERVGVRNPRHAHSLGLRSALEAYGCGGEPAFSTMLPATKRKSQDAAANCVDFIFYRWGGCCLLSCTVCLVA